MLDLVFPLVGRLTEVAETAGLPPVHRPISVIVHEGGEVLHGHRPAADAKAVDGDAMGRRFVVVRLGVVARFATAVWTSPR
jgi:hypothetical protein